MSYNLRNFKMDLPQKPKVKGGIGVNVNLTLTFNQIFETIRQTYALGAMSEKEYFEILEEARKELEISYGFVRPKKE